MSIISYFLRKKWIIGLFLALGLSVCVPSVFAASYKGYGGTVSEKSVNISMAVGETRTVILTFKNTGEKTWKRGTGTDQVSFDLLDAQPSPLQDGSWVNGEVPAQIKDASVSPGGSTTIAFRIHASKPGTSVATFRLASNGVAWMRETETKITVTVSGSKSVAVPKAGTAPAPSTSETGAKPPASSASAPTYSGILLLRSPKNLSAKGGEAVSVTYGFKNTGTAAWGSYHLEFAGVNAASAGSSNASVYDASWPSATKTPASSAAAKPGEIGFLNFTLRAPSARGSYTMRFALVADNKRVDGANIDIPITVTADGSYALTPPIVPGGTSAGSSLASSPEYSGPEPIIRVGLFRTTDDRMMVKGVSGPYRVFQNGTTVCSMTKDQVVTIVFDRTNLVYKLSGPNCMGQSSAPYQVQRTDGEWEALEMTDFSRPVSWLPGANDNTFRGILELRYAADDPDHDVWTINELPMEYYLKGIGETSDSSPLEYQKALLIAARTYGFYHWTRGTKHADRGFHIDGKYDQVYRGYGSEIRSPNIVAGVETTRGQIVTYQGKLAITPYFSRSDGRTRSWGEVWAGGSNYPWLVSVPVPQDAGRTLWGHGVGMSATGALGMANEGSDYASILKHFYTGIELMRYY